MQVASERERDTSKAGILSLKYETSVGDFPSFPQEANIEKLKEAIAKPLQALADERFGAGNIKVIVSDVRSGSIEFIFGLFVGAGGRVWTFFKDYTKVREGVKAFKDDIDTHLKPLYGKIRKIYFREADRWRTLAQNCQCGSGKKYLACCGRIK